MTMTMRRVGIFFLSFLMFFSLTLTSSMASDKKSGESAKKSEVVKTKKDTAEKKQEKNEIKVNINTATEKELEKKLIKVGAKKAKAIIEFRKKHGPFKTPKDITKVKGIGDKIFQLNKDIIVVG